MAEGTETPNVQDPSEEEPEGEQEPEVDPEFVCGWIVGIRKDGAGIQFDPIENENYERKGTLQDMDMAFTHLSHHCQALMAADRMLTLLNDVGKGKLFKSKGRIIH
jgi:hypothetical protein